MDIMHKGGKGGKDEKLFEDLLKRSSRRQTLFAMGKGGSTMSSNQMQGLGSRIMKQSSAISAFEGGLEGGGGREIECKYVGKC